MSSKRLTASSSKPSQYTLTSTGETINIYTPPAELILTIKPEAPKPALPLVTMTTAAGPQDRLAKKGDVEFEQYERDVEAWEKRQDDLQSAARLVTALRDFEFPKLLTIENFPSHVRDLMEIGVLTLDEHPLIAKLQYLRSTILESQEDESEIEFIIQQRLGVPSEVIDAVKANFRRALLGTAAGELGETLESENAEPAEDKSKS